MPSPPSFHVLWRLFQILLFFACQCVHGYLERDIVHDGLSSALKGYTGTVFQAIRYEPLCGTLGDASARRDSLSIGHCGPVVMNAYSNNSDTFAVYDESGARLGGVVIGAGLEVCMCFSLRTASGSAADMCWFVSGDGQVDIWYSVQTNYIIAGSYRPGSVKSLHQCSDIDLSAAQASWSATAVTRTTTSEPIRSVITTITGADGRVTTSSVSYTTGGQGLSRSDQIALGIGLGLGIPGFLVALAGLIMKRRRMHQRH